MIYTLSHAYGPFWFLDKPLFQNLQKHTESLEKLNIEKERSDEVFIKEFRKKYSNPLPPSWMILEISSFVNLSSFYYNLKPGLIKRQIANYFGLEEHVFESWLHCLVYIRNICAHHARLWNRVLSISPQIPLNPQNQWLTLVDIQNPLKGDKLVRINNRSYFLLSMIIYLLNTINQSHSFSSKVKALFSKYPLIDKKAMGFTKEWEFEKLWK